MGFTWYNTYHTPFTLLLFSSILVDMTGLIISPHFVNICYSSWIATTLSLCLQEVNFMLHFIILEVAH